MQTETILQPEISLVDMSFKFLIYNIVLNWLYGREGKFLRQVSVDKHSDEREDGKYDI